MAYTALFFNSRQQFSDSFREKRLISGESKSASSIAFCTVGLDWAADPSNTAALAAISGSTLSNKLGFII